MNRDKLGWLVFLVLSAGCRSDWGPMRVGLALSLDEAGVVPMRLGAELAAREINAAGGINGRPLELLQRNDYGSNDSAVAVAGELYDTDALAVIGGAYSGVTLASAPVYNGGKHPLVQLSPSASSPVVTEAGEYTFRICPSDLAYGAALARFASGMGLRRAAVLYVNDEYGRGMRRTFSDEYLRAGGEVIEVDPFMASAPDVGVYLTRIAHQQRAQVIVLATNQEEGLPVLRQIRAAKLGLPILAGDGMVGAERTDPNLMEGVFISSAYIVGTPGEVNRAFVSNYRKAYPDAGLPDQGAAASYDAVHLLAKVLSIAGSDRARVRATLADVGAGNPPYDGVVGKIGFDANGDVPALVVQVGVARGGELVPAQ